ncbi:hypothetical protein SEA_ILLUMINE_99 [Mycobacterium phage Illumine]|nr:hypothetical protein SEA_DOLE_98 [Mycobacterium phage Dole]UDL14773.1 hypothetical protein SEA_DEVERA_102 [Mycobacterium phage Devera]UDL15035.1 hypothetical protein SEA_ILLUMINE_99 [Mycobacterium phage Illumine]
MRLSPRRAESWFCATDMKLGALVEALDIRKRYAERHSERARVFVFSFGKLLIVWDRDSTP